MTWLSVKEHKLPIEKPIFVKTDVGYGCCIIQSDGWIEPLGVDSYAYGAKYKIGDITHFQVIEE